MDAGERRARQGVHDGRDELGVRVARATRGALAVSLPAFAFGLIRSDAEARGLEVPRLRSGADVDQDIAWVLAEQERSAGGPRWPEQLSSAVRSFATLAALARFCSSWASVERRRRVK